MTCLRKVGVLTCLAAAVFATGSAAYADLPPFPDVDTFENGGHPGDPVWSRTGTGQGWEFLSSSAGNGVPGFALTGQIISGGPEGKYGRYDGPDDSAAVFNVQTAPVFGSFNFNAMFDPYNPAEQGQLRFWLNYPPGEAFISQKPAIYFNTLSDGSVRMQFTRQNAGDWIDDTTSFDAAQWYNFDIRYSTVASSGEWTMVVRDLAGNTVFDEGIVYHWNTLSGPGAFQWAAFDKRADASDGAPSPAWNIDEINALAPQRDADFGIQRIREKDFLIMGTAIDQANFDLNEYRNAGFNQVFVNNNNQFAQQMANAGEDYHLHYGPGIGGDPGDDYSAYGVSHKIFLNGLASVGGLENNTGIANFQAIMLPDEPSTVAQLNNLAESNQWLHHFRPEVMTYVNLAGGVSASFINDTINIVAPDALSFDVYPTGYTPVFDRNILFSDTMKFRAATLAANIPLFVFVQGSDLGDGARQPSDSENRLHAWATLAAGAKAITYFTYDDDAGGGIESLFFDSGGNPTQFYSDAADANAEIANVGKSLRFLTSTDVRFVGGGVSSTPTGLTDWDAGAGPGTRIVGVSVDGAPEQDKDGLISFFTDDNGQDYFMLVNMYTDPTLDADQTELDFTVTFDNTVDAVWRLSRDTGEAEKIDLVSHILNLMLPGGTGDLFKYNNGNFAGLPLALLLGDFNLDGIISGLDIQKFIDAFTNESQYKADNGLSDADFLTIADINGDTIFSGLDIDPFVDLLTGGGASLPEIALLLQSVPEPGVAGLMGVLLGGMMLRRRRRGR